MKTKILVGVLTVLLLACETKKEVKEEIPTLTPNIVLIVADDLGYPYAGFMGDTLVQTPSLDKLAKLGTVFESGMVPESHCAPSLQTIITGLHCEEYDQHQERYREAYRDSLTSGMNSEDSLIWEQDFQWKSMAFFQTLPRYLAEKNYKSFQGGKWWGFNYQSGGFTHGMSTGWTKEDRTKKNFFYDLMGNEGLKLGRVTNQPVFDFIDQYEKDPFFVWYAPDLPHYPLNAADSYYNIYADMPLTESAKRYYANVTWFDDQIGALLDYFEKKGLMENTLFIYVNDNGWDQEPGAEYRHDSLRWHNGGPKGKGAYFDQSYRTPIIFTWKGTLPQAQVKRELVSSMDLLPTILDYVEIQSPENLDGKSLIDNIAGTTDKGHEKLIGRITQLFDPDDPSFMGKPAEGYWLRTEQYHYVWDITNTKELLFDVQADPMNDNNIADDNQEMILAFKDDIENWKKEIGIE